MFEEHATEVGGGEQRARAENMDERPKAATPPPRRKAARTLYAGRSEGKGKHRTTALATEDEAKDDEKLTHVNAARVAKRVELQRYLDECDDGRHVLPTSRVQEYMRWEAEDPKTVWRHTDADSIELGIHGIDNECSDPVMRLHVRSCGFETGTRTVRTNAGLAVTLDASERHVLAAEGTGAEAMQRKRASLAANGRVGAVTAGLHFEHHFTDGWATDGSKKAVWERGAWRTRVACGAYRGVVLDDEDEGEGDTVRTCNGIGAGMIGRRLPACYEVVDAELHAVLLALRTTAEASDAQKRRVLIMSDCLSALRMIEHAWRHGVDSLAWATHRARGAAARHQHDARTLGTGGHNVDTSPRRDVRQRIRRRGGKGAPVRQTIGDRHRGDSRHPADESGHADGAHGARLGTLAGNEVCGDAHGGGVVGAPQGSGAPRAPGSGRGQAGTGVEHTHTDEMGRGVGTHRSTHDGDRSRGRH
jgi:hypothetical protein